MTQLCKTNIGWHEEELAFMLYARARAKLSLALGTAKLNGSPRQPTDSEKSAYKQEVRSAVSLLEAQNVPREAESLSDDDRRVLLYIDAWNAELAS